MRVHHDRYLGSCTLEWVATAGVGENGGELTCREGGMG